MISVIIPIYNSEKYLAACLESVINQTYQNLEIICVNDGSSDGSFDILENYQKKDNRIKIIDQNNYGVSSARNHGLSLASGEYISFIDSDDELDLNMYKTLLELAEKSNADIAHCGYKKVELNGYKKDVIGSNVLLIQDTNEAIQCLIKGKYFAGGIWNKLYKKNIVEQLYFDENLKINEDVLWNYEAFKNANKIIFWDKTLYYYFEREQSSCNKTKIVKKSHDCSIVARKIYEDCLGSQLEVCARDKYFLTLANEYRAILFSTMENKEILLNDIRAVIERLLPKVRNISKKYILNVKLMFCCPKIYKVLYYIYDRIRKPNWDIKND